MVNTIISNLLYLIVTLQCSVSVSWLFLTLTLLNQEILREVKLKEYMLR